MNSNEIDAFPRSDVATHARDSAFQAFIFHCFKNPSSVSCVAFHDDRRRLGPPGIGLKIESASRGRRAAGHPWLYG